MIRQNPSLLQVICHRSANFQVLSHHTWTDLKRAGHKSYRLDRPLPGILDFGEAGVAVFPEVEEALDYLLDDRPEEPI